MSDAARIEELEYEVADLKRQLGQNVDETVAHILASRLKIRASEARLLLALYQAKGRMVTANDLEEVCRVDHAAEYYSRVIDVYVCRIRKQFGYGFIETVWARGYRMTPAASGVIDEMLKEVLAA